MSCTKSDGPILAYDMFPPEGCAFWGVIDNAAHLGVKSPIAPFRELE